MKTISAIHLFLCCLPAATLHAAPVQVSTASIQETLLIAPLAPAGVSVQADSTRITRKLFSALEGGLTGLGLMGQGSIAGNFGDFGADTDACASPADCTDALAQAAGVRYVLEGRFGEVNARKYLLLNLRDARAHNSFPLRTASWRAQNEERAALEGVCRELALVTGKSYDFHVFTAGYEGKNAVAGKVHGKRDVTKAMTLALLPGVGFAYLDRYDLATAYFLAEIVAAVYGVYALGQKKNSSFIAAGLTGVGIKYAEIIHTGALAKRQNKEMGFAQLKIRPVVAPGRNFASIGGIHVELSRRF